MEFQYSFDGPATMTSYYVHSSAVIDVDVTIGDGTKIWHFSHVRHVMRVAAVGAIPAHAKHLKLTHLRARVNRGVHLLRQRGRSMVSMSSIFGGSFGPFYLKAVYLPSSTEEHDRWSPKQKTAERPASSKSNKSRTKKKLDTAITY